MASAAKSLAPAAHPTFVRIHPVGLPLRVSLAPQIPPKFSPFPRLRPKEVERAKEI